MTKPSLEEVLNLLDIREEGIAGGNEIKLQKKYGLDSLVSVYIEAFYKIKNWPGRMNIAFWLVRYAKINPEIIELAIYGLNDRSRIVRNYCCSILAYAQDRETIHHLEKLKKHKNKTTQADAVAAIDAIVNKNHHLWADRSHTGNVFWHPGKVA